MLPSFFGTNVLLCKNQLCCQKTTEENSLAKRSKRSAVRGKRRAVRHATGVLYNYSALLILIYSSSNTRKLLYVVFTVISGDVIDATYLPVRTYDYVPFLFCFSRPFSISKLKLVCEHSRQYSGVP